MHERLYSSMGRQVYPHSCYDISSKICSRCFVEEELPHLFFERRLGQANFGDLVWEIFIKLGRPWIWMLG